LCRTFEYAKYQNTSTIIQKNSKRQYPKLNKEQAPIVCYFEFLVIVIYLLFAIWNFSPTLKSFFNDQTGRPAGQWQGRNLSLQTAE
jgi:hypothetical protein